MSWRKRTPTASTVKDVVIGNTGLSENDIVNPPREPYLFHLDEAVDMIKSHVSKRTPISIMGDYDADGITASAIMYLIIKAMDKEADVCVRLPKRFSEGYGLSETALDEFKPGLLITVDNGIVAVDQIRKAKEKGFDTLVTDHHLVREDGILPDADLILDPNVPEDPSEFHGYCGAGIAFRIAQKLLEPNSMIMKYITALAAIGTIADVMDILLDNRNIVKEGLEFMNRGVGGGLEALLQKLDICGYVCEDDIGFKVGPVINAAGRMRDDGAAKAFQLLVTIDDFNHAKDLAEELAEINELRKQTVKDGLETAKAIIADECLYGESPLIVSGDFHEGVVGIIAGRLCEEFGVPTFVLAEREDGLCKGSGRSNGIVHLKNLLDSASSLLVGYGGHADACGLSVKKECLEPLKELLMNTVATYETEEKSSQDQYYDLEIDASQISDMYSEVAKYAPYGHGNPKVIFKINNFTLTPKYGKFSQRMGDGSIIKLFGVTCDAIGFGLAGLYEAEGEPKSINLYGTLGTNTYMGRQSKQIEMMDMKKNVEAGVSPSSLMGILQSRMKLAK